MRRNFSVLGVLLEDGLGSKGTVVNKPSRNRKPLHLEDDCFIEETIPGRGPPLNVLPPIASLQRCAVPHCTRSTVTRNHTLMVYPDVIKFLVSFLSDGWRWIYVRVSSREVIQNCEVRKALRDEVKVQILSEIMETADGSIRPSVYVLSFSDLCPSGRIRNQA